jgi:uncharacterized membrane protein YcaP (DUF421 family)
MEILEMILAPIVSLIVLFVLTKMMGYRQVAQLSMYDYIIGITFGSIAADFIMEGFSGFLRAVIGMSIYTIFTILLSYITRKNTRSRRLIDGQAVVLYENDCLYNKELDKAKMDIDEFLMDCRIAGYFNLQELDTIILETNGRLSFFPKEKNRPAQVGDLGVKVQGVKPPSVLIKEGEIHLDNLKKINKDTTWLENTIKNANLSLDEIILMYQEENSNIQILSQNNLTKKYQ